jgi:hypothetical protein
MEMLEARRALRRGSRTWTRSNTEKPVINPMFASLSFLICLHSIDICPLGILLKTG